MRKFYQKNNRGTYTEDHMLRNMVVKISIWILRFYDSTYPKRSKSFQDLCDRLGLYDSNDLKRP